ncbi:hypothetical protein J6590_036481 [Homalodisca vitripennis]|nr:hypothetical protein J6590_036481 [Homalodisca vitripennis]
MDSCECTIRGLGVVMDASLDPGLDIHHSCPRTLGLIIRMSRYGFGIDPLVMFQKALVRKSSGILRLSRARTRRVYVIACKVFTDELSQLWTFGYEYRCILSLWRVADTVLIYRTQNTKIDFPGLLQWPLGPFEHRGCNYYGGRSPFPRMVRWGMRSAVGITSSTMAFGANRCRGRATPRDRPQLSLRLYRCSDSAVINAREAGCDWPGPPRPSSEMATAAAKPGSGPTAWAFKYRA